MVAQRADVGGTPSTIGDDEVGVQGADARRADPEALQAGGLDEPAGMVARWVSEDTARVLVRERLRRPTPRLVFVDTPGNLRWIASGEYERGGQDDLG